MLLDLTNPEGKNQIVKYTVDKNKCFTTPQQLVEYLNELTHQTLCCGKSLEFAIDSNGFVSIEIPAKLKFDMDRQLQNLLGFYGPHEFECLDKQPADRIIVAPDKADVYRIKTAYICTNLCQPQIIGDKLLPVLEVVNVPTGADETISFEISKPRYAPVALKNISSPSIYLLNQNLEPIHIDSSVNGTIVKLHFKKV